MRVSNSYILNLNFSSKKTFKKMFDTCTYSGEKFERHNTRTIEHIIPKSEGGKDELSNYLVVKRTWNQKRSSVPLAEFIKVYPETRKNIVSSVKSLDGVEIDGINWSEEVKKTLLKAIGYDIFK